MRIEENKVKPFWNERWVEVPTKAPTNKVDYFISDHGRVKSVDKKTLKERLLKGSHNPATGYDHLCMKLQGGLKQSFVKHRLIGELFIPRPSDKHIYLIHLDQDKLNNHYKNLKWFTRQELNERWKELEIYKDTHLKQGHVKMSESKVKLLKQRLEKGKTKNRILAKQFDISVTQLKRIARGENWGHIK